MHKHQCDVLLLEESSLATRLFQLAMACAMDLGLSPSDHMCHIADGLCRRTVL